MDIREKATFFQVINNPITYKFFKDFTNHRKENNTAVISSSRPFPNILKYRDQRRDLPTIWKTKFFRHILKSSASIYESSGWQFFRTTAGIQSGPGAFDETRFVITFLTIVGVMETAMGINFGTLMLPQILFVAVVLSQKQHSILFCVAVFTLNLEQSFLMRDSCALNPSLKIF